MMVTLNGFECIKGNGTPAIDGDDRVPALTSLIVQASTQGNYAKVQGDYAKAQGEYINEYIETNLNNIDNTSDMAKPVSDATLEALDLKADLEFGKLNSTQIPPNYKGMLPAPIQTPKKEVYSYWEIDKIEDGIYYVPSQFIYSLNMWLQESFMFSDCLLTKLTIDLDGTLATHINLYEIGIGMVVYGLWGTALSEANEDLIQETDWNTVSVGYAFATNNYYSGGNIEGTFNTKADVVLPSYLTILQPLKGRMAFNITTNKPVWYSGTHWIYADGSLV